ncbi:MAG: sialidase family protein [Planctomycetota bacterium]|nr:sialidase family protein [Planctomycetota bacterium]
MKTLSNICRLSIVLAALGVLLASASIASAADTAKDVPREAFKTKATVAFQELDEKYCWFHPRAAVIPGGVAGDKPIAIMTIQQHLRVSDFYSGLYTMRSDDLGKTWSKPVAQPSLAWVIEPSGITIAVADVTPGWHGPSGKLLAIGCMVRYSKKGHQLKDVKRFSQTHYAVYDPKKDEWSKWKLLEMPADDKFNMARNACAQWIVEKDGTLLVPMYFGSGKGPSSVTVTRCSFDGKELKYIKHGNEMSLNVVRGLGEPSIAKFQGRYYLTIRNDVKGYVTSSDDGLNFKPIKPWMFDDGKELGSYNTQQHWINNDKGLFLVYTRRGANNDHIMRHRAPLFIAQVDPRRLCVIRDTEKIVVPERGTNLGNFGCNAVNERESWVTTAEYMNNTKPKKRGANGSIYVGRVIFDAGEAKK